MRNLICLLAVLIGIQLQAEAQKKWKDTYYVQLTDANFRDFRLFNQPIDHRNIDYKVLNAVVFFVTNEARLEKGLPALEFQPNLEIMAWNHSISMAEKDFFDHLNPKDRKRRDPRKRARLAGIVNPNIGENIGAYGGQQFGDYLELADFLVDEWIDSPPHRKTLYSKDALQLGCGIYYYDGLWRKNKGVLRQGSGFWLATQNFQLFTKVESGPSKDKGPK